MPSLLAPPTLRSLLNVVGLVSLAALGAALVSQYAFGLRPCHLCLWQRWPYAALGLIGAAATLVPRAPLKALWMVALVLLAGEIGLAAYHSAVERHLIAGPTECSSGMDARMDVEALRAKILGAAVTRCDEPTWLVPGLTMANANLLLALGLFAYALRGRRLMRKETQA